MTNLILITNYFPYGNDTGEMYLRTEIDILSKVYKKVTIFSLDAVQAQMKIELPHNVVVFPLGYKGNRISKYFFGTIKELILKSEPQVQEERKNLKFMQKIFLSYFIAKVDKRIKAVRNIINFSKEDTVVYAYRFFDAAYLAIKIKELYYPNSVIVCRAHGYDLYEEQNSLRYLPMRRYLLKQLDRVFPCSKNGTDYLQKKYPEFEGKIKCSYLGSQDFGMGKNKGNQEKLELISCSNVIPVKQVEKIAAVVREISKSREVHWTHIGSGKLLKKIKCDNIDLVKDEIISFDGNCTHQEVINHYKNKYYDFFINLSLSEGVPQAIMEAISFGIPAVATNVGGNSEIVKECVSGYMVGVNTSVKKIANIIIQHKDMPINKQIMFRNNTRDFWSRNFNSEVNSKIYINDINKACEEE